MSDQCKECGTIYGERCECDPQPAVNMELKLHCEPEPSPAKEVLTKEEIADLQKKGRLCYRPGIDDKGVATTTDNAKYHVGADKVWRKPVKRVRMSKKERMRQKKRNNLSAAITADNVSRYGGK